MFADRSEAGMALAEKLEKFRNTDLIVLALPRGGVPVAHIVAKELNAPLDVIMVKKIGHPMNKEFAIGAADLNDLYVIPDINVTTEYLHKEVNKIRIEMKRRHELYTGNQKPLPIKGKTVVIVDDGIATGNTMIASIKLIKKSRPGKVVVAVPVAPASAEVKLLEEADEFISAKTPENFYGVGQFYKDFHQVSDKEVIELLQGSRQEALNK